MYRAALTIGEGRYRIERRLAVSGLSTVYAGTDTQSGQEVALKVLHPEHAAHMDIVLRFVNEAFALSILDHPGIVRLLGWGPPGTAPPFLVLQMLGNSLAERLARSDKLMAPNQTTAVIAAAATTLAVIHRRGIVHRDIKPANILFSEETAYDPILIDFGLAKILPPKASPPTGQPPYMPVSTGDETQLGTSEYMAPEQWTGSAKVDGKADVYSLGVVWFQLLTGQLPFQSEQERVLMGLHLFEPPPLHLLPADLVPEVREVLRRTLTKNRAERLAAQELADSLHPFII